MTALQRRPRTALAAGAVARVGVSWSPDQRTAPRPARVRRRTTGPAVLVAVVLVVAYGAQLGRLYAGVGRDRDYWSVPHGPKGGLLYVALGDSAAQGVGAGSPDRGYVGLLADRLRTSTGRPVRVVNLSVSGARVRDVLRDQVPALQALHPDVVTVDVGGNDVRAYDAVRFDRDTTALVAALPAGTVVADVPWFMHGHWERDAREAAGVVRARAAARHLPVAPLHAALRRQGWSAMLTQFAPDLFHPDDRGHQVWADAFWEQVRLLPPVVDGGGGVVPPR
ncbi:MAG: esterase [Frankiales bacterium]|nr:esterase [Frankiales bacterium]